MPTKRKARTNREAKEGELVLARVFDAPRERVWKAWTEPAQFERWWGPKGFTVPACTIDLRVGGKYLYCMRSPDGKDYWGTGVYREIVPTKKLVATDSFADAKGNVVPGTHYGMSADFPREMLVTVTFEDLGAKTKLTLRHTGFPAGPDRALAEQGWSESLDKLVASLTVDSAEPEFVAE
ncbi:MAG: SRPBCC family protein [Methanobacteriota archaeon]